VHVPFFVAHVGEGEVVLEDDVHDAHRWVSFAEAEAMLEFAAQRRILGEVQRAFIEREPHAWRIIR
jgi:hypothetical protein